MPINLSQINFFIPEIFKTKVSYRFWGIKSPFKFVFSRFELAKVILDKKKAGVQCSC